MPSSPSIDPSPSRLFGDNTMAVWLGVGLLALALLSWMGLRWVRSDSIEQPVPVWVKLPLVESQMADGKMLSVEVGLEMRNQRSEGALDDYKGAMAATVQAALQRQTRQTMEGPEGMRLFAGQIKIALNDFLRDRDEEERVRSVQFQQFTLLP